MKKGYVFGGRWGVALWAVFDEGVTFDEGTRSVVYTSGRHRWRRKTADEGYWAAGNARNTVGFFDTLWGRQRQFLPLWFFGGMFDLSR
jgi:hypothetical protein